MFTEFWKTWVFDPAYCPVQWQNHPHCAFKGVSRYAAAFLGSIVPVCLLLIQILQTDVLGQIGKGTTHAFPMLALVTAAFVASWLCGLIFAATSEEKTLRKHIFLGASPPSALSLVYLTLQGPQ